MDKEFDKIYQTFIEELSALSPDERFELMNMEGVYFTRNALPEASASYPAGERLPEDWAAVLFIANSSNTCIRAVKLTCLTPKALEGYCETVKALNARSSEVQELLERMTSREYDNNCSYYEVEFLIYDTETQLCSKHTPNVYSDYCDVYSCLSMEMFVEIFGLPLETEAEEEEAYDMYSLYLERFYGCLFPTIEEFAVEFGLPLEYDYAETEKLYDIYTNGNGFITEDGKQENILELWNWLAGAANPEAQGTARYRLIISRFYLDSCCDISEDGFSYYYNYSYSLDTASNSDSALVFYLTEEQYQYFVDHIISSKYYAQDYDGIHVR